MTHRLGSAPTKTFVSDPIIAFSYLHRARWTGQLDMHGESGPHFRAWFCDGVPKWIQLPGDVQPLGRMLVDDGVITAYELPILCELAHTSHELIELLHGRGAADFTTLAPRLARCLKARVTHLMGLSRLRFVVVDDARLAWPPLMTAVEVFLSAARIPANFEHVDRYIGRLGAMLLDLDPSDRLRIRDFSVHERAVIASLSSLPETVAELINGGIPLRDVHATVFALSVASVLRRAQTTERAQTRSADPAPSRPGRGSSSPAGVSSPESAPHAWHGIPRSEHSVFRASNKPADDVSRDERAS